jgi:iron complex transport system substrate-binding protein
LTPETNIIFGARIEVHLESIHALHSCLVLRKSDMMPPDEAAHPANCSDLLSPSGQIRIVSLIPSATDIVCHLGLQDCLVGITHCCDRDGLRPSVLVVTEDQIHAASISQVDINSKVDENAQRAEGVLNGSTPAVPGEELPSLYPINRELLKKAAPTIILTQDLCNVCAPSSLTVFRALEQAGIRAKVVLLSPTSLEGVIASMQQIADAAGISAIGKQCCEELQSNLTLLERLVREKRTPVDDSADAPSLLLMEWVDPPFCGGHWISDMARLVGAKLAIAPHPDGRSRRVTWEEIGQADPDVVVVACCGFDLDRNLDDASMAKEKFAKLRSTKEGKLFAANGDQFFARPSPKLLTGTVIMALCVYDEKSDPALFEAIRSLNFASNAWNSYQNMKF